MPLLDEIIGWAGGLRPWQQEALRRIFARAELTQDDIETILRMVREQEREDATRGSKPEPPKIPSADQRGLSRARSMG